MLDFEILLVLAMNAVKLITNIEQINRFTHVQTIDYQIKFKEIQWKMIDFSKMDSGVNGYPHSKKAQLIQKTHTKIISKQINLIVKSKTVKLLGDSTGEKFVALA